jgi:hypothetical protein
MFVRGKNDNSLASLCLDDAVFILALVRVSGVGSVAVSFRLVPPGILKKRQAVKGREGKKDEEAWSTWDDIGNAPNRSQCEMI